MVKIVPGEVHECHKPASLWNFKVGQVWESYSDFSTSKVNTNRLYLDFVNTCTSECVWSYHWSTHSLTPYAYVCDCPREYVSLCAKSYFSLWLQIGAVLGRLLEKLSWVCCCVVGIFYYVTLYNVSVCHNVSRGYDGSEKPADSFWLIL